MNPKSEFVKAIMSVLRLEANIYTNGAIEAIIERLEVSDYQLFIAYLGERKSDYEKPIENIAKGVEEFYKIKLRPHEDKAQKMINNISNKVDSLKAMIREQSAQEVEESDDIKKQIEISINNSHGKQSEQAKENAKYNLIIEHKNTKYEEKIDVVCEYEIDNEFFKNLIVHETKETLFNDIELDVLFFSGGLREVFNRGYRGNNNFENGVYEYFLKDKIRPSIEERIELNEDNEITNAITYNAVKQLANKSRY